MAKKPFGTISYYFFMESCMSSIVFLNGDFCKEEDAKVSIFDRGYLFGDGIYEVVPVINGKVIDKEPFFERFDASMSKIGLKAPF